MIGQHSPGECCFFFPMSLASTVRDNLILRRSLAFLFHLTGLVSCYYLAFLIRFDFSLAPGFAEAFKRSVVLVVPIFLLLIIAFKLYQGLWRFFSFRDCLVVAFVFALGTGLLAVAIYLRNAGDLSGYPRSVLLIFYLLTLGWEIGGRGMVRLFREWRIEKQSAQRETKVKRIILVGDAEQSDQAVRVLRNQMAGIGKVIALFSPKKRHEGSKLHGIRIFSDLDDIGKFVKDNAVDTTILLPPFTTPGRIKMVVDEIASQKVSCEFRVVPSYEDIATGRVDVDRIRRVDIADLLERAPYKIDYQRLESFVKGKVILVTGAGGSIGSEICRQIAKLQPGVLVLCDHSEFLLFQVERELSAMDPDLGLVATTTDIRNSDEVERLFQAQGEVDVVFHAAAYKHVDLMERNAKACFQNNVIGTALLAEVAERFGVGDFVLVSSDKAVRPTSVMGASKRLAERCLMERPESPTRFKAVRFGNVLGSSGSVVPIFREQIASGGPVTVTSREVTRYFMTIPEAVELVIAAGSQKVDRRVFVLEMGEPVKIDVLARRMIELSGFVPDVDIDVVYTGLKPGEKEYEELLTDDENVERTELDRIWVVKKLDGSIAEELDLAQLKELIDTGSEAELRDYANRVVPGSRMLQA